MKPWRTYDRRRALMPVVLSVAAVLSGCGVSARPTLGPSPTPSTVRAADWPAPRNDLTPGALDAGCTYPRPKTQRDVTQATRDTVDAWYHYRGPFGLAHVEYDHRIPFSLCGSNGPLNLWPEPYDGAPLSKYVHNRKDQLEEAITAKLQNHGMTLPEAVTVFEGDWRVAWCKYVHKPGVVC